MKLKLAPGIVLGVGIAILAGQTAFARTTDHTPSAVPDSESESSEKSSEARNPYDIIVDRNVFRLTDPPPPVVPTNETALPNIKLTGLIKIAGHEPRAMFVSSVKDAKALYYNLAEGEREGTLELVKILEDQEAAEVINAGSKMTVLLKDSKEIVKPGAAPLPSVPPPYAGMGRPPAGFPSAPPQQVPPPVIQGQPAQGQPQQADQPSRGGGGVFVSGAPPSAPTAPVVNPAPQGGVPPPPQRIVPTRTIRPATQPN